MMCAGCGKEGFSLCPECSEKIMLSGNWLTGQVKVNGRAPLTGPCFNENCPNHDRSESGCRSHSLYAVDLCNSYMTCRNVSCSSA